MRRSLLAICLVAVPLAVVCACSSGSNAPADAQQQGKVVGKSTGLEVSVALAATRLGDEKCTHDESMDPLTKSCPAQLPDSGAPRGTGSCGGPCKFSNLQLAFTASAGSTPMHVAISSAELLDASSGAVVQTLTAYTPLKWNGAAYVTWDENVAPAAETKASYTVSPPEWSTIDPSNSFSHQYKVRVVVTLDGNTVTLESDALNRDPPVAT